VQLLPQLQTTISELFSGGKCQVRLVIAGTGIEGADHRIGSQPKFVLPYHVRPRIWPALMKKLPSEAKAVKLLLENDESTLVRIVNGMVQNARVAAVFDRELRSGIRHEHSMPTYPRSTPASL
jgi:hypothetical protein